MSAFVRLPLLSSTQDWARNGISLLSLFSVMDTALSLLFMIMRVLSTLMVASPAWLHATASTNAIAFANLLFFTFPSIR